MNRTTKGPTCRAAASMLSIYAIDNPLGWHSVRCALPNVYYGQLSISLLSHPLSYIIEQ